MEQPRSRIDVKRAVLIARTASQVAAVLADASYLLNETPLTDDECRAVLFSALYMAIGACSSPVAMPSGSEPEKVH